MNRRRLIFSAALATVVLLAAAIWFASRFGTAGGQSVGRNNQLLTDMSGRQVRVPVQPRRILSLCTTATDTVVALGAADRLVAIDEYSRIVPGSDRAVAVGKGSALSRESVLSLQIDLAFIWWYQDDAAALLEDLAIPAIRIRSGRAAELPATIRLIGQCLDTQAAAEPLATRLEAFLASSSGRPAGPRVFLELNGPYKTVGRDTYTNDLLELAGTVNIASDTTGSVLLSAERLTQADPDVILLAGEPSDLPALIQRPGFSSLRAVRQGRVFALDRYWLVAGPNLPQSVEKIRAAIAAQSVATAAKE
jgi:iron complex transport system substrate-binding protein